MKTKNLIQISMMSALIAVISQLSIPMPYGVPMTLQSLIIPLVGVMLGAKNGTISTIIYIFLGLVGLPVFANFGSGLTAILGPTGGFILTFPIMAYFAGISYDKSKIFFMLMLLFSAFINYAVGTFYFSIVTNTDILLSISYCVIPFIPTTIIKTLIILFFAKPIKSRLRLN